MPMYVFECKKCKLIFESLYSIKEAENATCDTCGKKVKRLLTAPGAVIFTNPKGTSREDNFEYVAKYNYERATGERRAAEAAQKDFKYNEIDDMPQFEGKIS
jgi:putative FmdB family regulatory protein